MTTNIRQWSQLAECQVLNSMLVSRFPLKIIKNEREVEKRNRKTALNKK